MAEAHPLPLHHPGDHIPARLTPEATPQILLGADREARGPILMERTAPDMILATALQLDPARLDEPHQAHPGLQPLQLVFRDARHARASKNLSRHLSKNNPLFFYPLIG